MKRLKDLRLVLLLVIMLLPLGSVWAQTSAKKSPAQVPITYPGDTDETIRRRAQWIEGAKEEGKIDWWSSVKVAEAAKLIAAFNKVYPFITVEHWSARGEAKAAKLEADFTAGRFSVDIVGGEPYDYPRWRKMGMLEKFADILPGFKHMDRRTVSKYNDWATEGNNGTTAVYNTKLVPAAEAPKSWEDLLDPKWKGQIALASDTKLWMILAVEEGGWGVEKTENFLKRLKQQQIIWAASFANGHTLLVSGDFKILGQSYIANTFKAQAKGAPVALSRVSPVIISGPTTTLQKRAPHPNAARLLLEWLFSPQGLVTYEKITSYGLASPGSGTKLAKALEGLPLVYRTEEGIIKSTDMGLREKFAKILGVTRD